MCKPIIKGLARRNRQKLAILSEIKKNNNTSYALMTSPAKNQRDFGVYEKVGEREAIAQYQVTPVTSRHEVF